MIHHWGKRPPGPADAKGQAARGLRDTAPKQEVRGAVRRSAAHGSEELGHGDSAHGHPRQSSRTALWGGPGAGSAQLPAGALTGVCSAVTCVALSLG